MFPTPIARVLTASALLLMCIAQNANSQPVRSPVARPAPTTPVEKTTAPLPLKIALPAWQFADIRVTVLGPNNVKIDWMPLQGADQYIVSRNGGQIGPTYTSVPTATQPMTVLDNNAPANSTLSYSITARHPGTIQGLPNTPAAGAHSGELNLQVSRTVTVVTPAGPLPPLSGWADLHTHPMSQLAFGGKLFHGAPDILSIMPGLEVPRNTGCLFDLRAGSIDQALSQDGPTHGDPFQSKCGDLVRNSLVKLLEVFNSEAQQQPGNAEGLPSFGNWPLWNDISHQKMWWEWIRRARDGGLRVMVAFAHNNRTLGEAMLQGHPGGPVSGVADDMRSADLQVDEIRAFVSHHPDFMELALTSADLYGIVQRNHIAVVLGVEVDNIGDLNDKQPVSTLMVDNELDRLYAKGVRYIFPIHVADNVFGDTAIYTDIFNVGNFRETGHFWTVGCSKPGDQVGYKSFNFPPQLNPFIPPGVPQPPRAPDCPVSSDPNQMVGHINVRTKLNGQPVGLTQLGEYAVKSMMKRGIIIDIDHMSNFAAERTLGIAEGVPGGYPVNSGHSAIRAANTNFNAENSRTPAQLRRVACLGGMFGLGTDGAKATDWASQYVQAFSIMNGVFGTPACTNAPLGPGMVSFGTDTNSLVKTPRPTMAGFAPGSPPSPRVADIYNPGNPYNRDRSTPGGLGNPLLPVLPMSQQGNTRWDYNLNGVAHYGMFADFVRDVRSAPAAPPGGMDLVDNHLMRSADNFYRMWQKAEVQKTAAQRTFP